MNTGTPRNSFLLALDKNLFRQRSLSDLSVPAVLFVFLAFTCWDSQIGISSLVLTLHLPPHLGKEQPHSQRCLPQFPHTSIQSSGRPCWLHLKMGTEANWRSLPVHGFCSSPLHTACSHEWQQAPVLAPFQKAVGVTSSNVSQTPSVLCSLASNGSHLRGRAQILTMTDNNPQGPVPHFSLRPTETELATASPSQGTLSPARRRLLPLLFTPGMSLPASH